MFCYIACCYVVAREFCVVVKVLQCGFKLDMWLVKFFKNESSLCISAEQTLST